MPFLSAPNPWAHVFSHGAEGLEARIRFVHKYLEPVTLSIEDETVVARTNLVTDPIVMAYDIAGILAHLWPDWLAELGIALSVQIPQVPRCWAPASAMVARVDATDPDAWRRECEFINGL